MAAIESLGELSVALSRSVTRARHRQVEDAVLLEKQPAQQTPAARLSLWRHHLEWLSQQTLERQAFVRVGERAPEMQLDGNDGDGGGGADGGAAVARSIERLQGEIDELQRQLYQLGAAYSNAQSTARRANEAPTMLAAMYDSSDTLGRSLNKAMVQRDRRASEASQLHDEARELKERLEHTRTLTFEARAECRALWERLKDDGPPSPVAREAPSTIAKLERQITAVTARVEILRQVLCLLVSGSGVQWAREPDLRAVLLASS